MIDFSNWLDLPLIWGFLIATAVFIYIILDGFDLGCGILFPFAPNEESKNKIMNSIAPFWDANETWLVLGGGGLFVAFPVAYGVILSALYIPVILMLIGLIFRGVAFEFRFKANGLDRKLWDIAFHIGSVLAAFMQGVILGNFIQGFEVTNRVFSGGSLDWANGLAITVGVALVFGYALLGATWIIMKSDGKLQEWARFIAKYVLSFVAIAMAVISLAMPLMDERIANLWFSLPNFLLLLPIPTLTLIVFIWLYRNLYQSQSETSPFFLSSAIFFLAYLGLAVSIYPWIVPFEFTLWQAAAVSTSQTITLIGTLIMLPVVLGYTIYCYRVFRGKSSADSTIY